MASLTSHASSTSWLVWITENDIRTAYNMAPRLETTREMRLLGWKVDLIACGPAGAHNVQGIDVMCFPRPRTYLLGNIVFHLHIVRYILRYWKHIQVVLFTQLSAQWILPLRLLRFPTRQGPVFVMDTRTVPMEPQDKATLKDVLRGQFLFLMNKLANWFADGQTTITKRMAECLAIPQKQLWGVWSSGVNIEKFSSAVQKRKWPEKSEPVVVIYIGALSYGRNLVTLCQSVLEANRRGMNFILWFYGEGEEKKNLKACAAQSQGCIQVFDAIPNEHIPDVLAGAHVGVLPFPDEERFRVSSPIKLFEYMGAGMPILATKIVCHTDVIGDDKFVFWANDSSVSGIQDALLNIWQQRFDLWKLSHDAVLASNNWTWVASAKCLHDALQHGLSLSR